MLRPTTALALLLPLLAASPSDAAPRHHRPRHAAAARHATEPAANGYGGWGSTVYGASLPSIDGSCTDPFDPDPIGGPDGVGAGGPGAFLGRCSGPRRVPGGGGR